MLDVVGLGVVPDLGPDRVDERIPRREVAVRRRPCDPGSGGDLCHVDAGIAAQELARCLHQLRPVEGAVAALSASLRVRGHASIINGT